MDLIEKTKAAVAMAKRLEDASNNFTEELKNAGIEALRSGLDLEAVKCLSLMMVMDYAEHYASKMPDEADTIKKFKANVTSENMFSGKDRGLTSDLNNN